MGILLRLVDPKVSIEAVEAVEHLLEQIRRGDVIGVAWVAMHRNNAYSVDIAGETRKAPTFTRGMLAALDDQLADIVRPR